MSTFSSKRAKSFKYLPWFSDSIFNNWIIGHLIPLGTSLCDVGAGTGIMSKIYRKHFDLVHAVEPSESMFQQLERNLAKYGNCFCSNSSAEEIPILTKGIDISISKSSLHHFLDIKKGVSEMFRIANNVVCIIEVIAPDEICIPFLENILVKKESYRKTSTVFTERGLFDIVSEGSDNIRSLIFDQYILVNKWLQHGDLNQTGIDEIKDIILNQHSKVKNKMQIHEHQNEIRMLRRMNLIIAFI